METDTEKKIQEAIALYEKGVSTSDLLLRFPEEAKELSEIFALMTRLTAEKEAMHPSSRLLATIVSQVPVTVEGEKRLLDIKRVRRPALGTLESFMSKWIYIAPIGVVAVLVLLFGMGKFSTPGGEVTVRDTTPIGQEETVQMKADTVVVPAASANVDEAINALLADSSSEAQTFDEELKETAQVDADTPEFNAFNQANDYAF